MAKLPEHVVKASKSRPRPGSKRPKAPKMPGGRRGY